METDKCMLLLGSSSCQSSCCLHSKCKTFDMRLVEQWEQGWSKKSLSEQLSLEDRKTKAGGRKEFIYETSKMRLTISFYAVKRDGLSRVKVHIWARDRFISTTPHKENHKTLTFHVHWLSIGGESLKSSQNDLSTQQLWVRLTEKGKVEMADTWKEKKPKGVSPVMFHHVTTSLVLAIHFSSERTSLCWRDELHPSKEIRL